MELVGCIPPDIADIDTFQDIYFMMHECDVTLARVIRSKQALTEGMFTFSFADT